MITRTTLISAALAATVLSYAQYPGSVEPPAEFKPGFNAITINDATTWLTYLATQCGGRGSTQPGFKKAADYMAARFKEMGLKPMGDNGTYFQMVPRVTKGTILEGTKFTGPNGFEVALGDNFNVSSARDNMDVSGQIVILHAKGDAKIPAGIAGKIVVATLEGVSRKYREDLKKAAKLVIEVTDTVPSRREFSYFGLGQGVTTGKISIATGKDFAAKVNFTPKAELADGETELSSEVGVGTVTVKAESTHEDVPNVVGVLEGSDPVLKNEYVGIGAHLDHMGTTEQGVVYPGADDDGSGSTALLGVIKGMHTNRVKPKRSILFMAFCGEEMGLIGSRWLADNPPVPLDKMTCELQMDMVGRDSEGVQNGDRNRVDVLSENHDTMRLVGSQRISTELHKLILEMNQHINFKFKYDAEDVYTRSDHYSFAAKGVPIAFQFDGFHPDYHQPTDTVDKINFLKLTSAAKLFYLVALRAANQPLPLVKDVPQTGNDSGR